MRVLALKPGSVKLDVWLQADRGCRNDVADIKLVIPTYGINSAFYSSNIPQRFNESSVNFDFAATFTPLLIYLLFF